jgi:hypothetical protein
MPTVEFEASNEVPARHKVTLLILNGFHFPGCSQVTLSIHQGDATGRVLSHAVAAVRADGTFLWHGSISPQQECHDQLAAVISDADGVTASATAEVICPPDRHPGRPRAAAEPFQEGNRR